VAGHQHPVPAASAQYAQAMDGFEQQHHGSSASNNGFGMSAASSSYSSHFMASDVSQRNGAHANEQQDFAVDHGVRNRQQTHKRARQRARYVNYFARKLSLTIHLPIYPCFLPSSYLLFCATP
jgi:hypothetical protein